MTIEATSKWRAALNTHDLDDALRGTTLAGIQKVAQQNALMQLPEIAASYAVLTAKGGALATNVAGYAAAAKQLKAIATQRAIARDGFDRALVTFKALVENNAASAGDITGMGLTLLHAAKPSKAPPDPPAALIVSPGKQHGKARVSVAGKGALGSFVAEVATAPTGPWSSLPGTRKQRKLEGYASGTQLWVRFAAVRWGMQSDWCQPVLVIIP